MKHLLCLSILSAAFFVGPTEVRACTCEIFGDGSQRSMMRHAKAVFIGEVLEVREATTEERESGFNSYVATMQVERYWKGVKSSEVKIQTDMTGCGPYLRVGDRLIVYGMGKNLNTACSGTRKLEYAEKDLKALGPGKVFKSK